VYVVQPGDTYWTIARRLQPTGDVRVLVDRLSGDHGGAPLQPGEQLVLR
jgi:LysM repeat protein